MPIFIRTNLMMWLTGGSYTSIALGPLILVAPHKDSPKLRNHESIHWEQYKELYIIGFLALYFYHWQKDGYWSVPFEKEAYDNEENLDYIQTRQKHAWKNYL